MPSKTKGWLGTNFFTCLKSRAKQKCAKFKGTPQTGKIPRSLLRPRPTALNSAKTVNGHNFFPSSSFSSFAASERDPQFLTVPLLSFLLSFRPSSSAFEYCSHPILGRRTGEARVPKCSRGAFPRKRCVYTTLHPPARDMFDNALLCKWT